MKDRKKALERKREQAVRRIAELGPWIQGSVVVVKRVSFSKRNAADN